MSMSSTKIGQNVISNNATFCEKHSLGDEEGDPMDFKPDKWIPK